MSEIKFAPRSHRAIKDKVLTREGHWKDCLLSRQFGYNEN